MPIATLMSLTAKSIFFSVPGPNPGLHTAFVSFNYWYAFPFFKLKYTWYTILVSGGLHSDLTFTYIMEWYGKSSKTIVPIKTYYTLIVTIPYLVCCTPVVCFRTGDLYLQCTPRISLPFFSGNTHLFSVSVSILFVPFFWCHI